MSRRFFAAIAVVGIALAASVAARPGIFEYWKAGAKTRESKSSLPRGSSSARQTKPSTQPPSTRAAVPWTEAWFSDSTQTRRRAGEIIGALTVPMIGQTYPLPRGGGFVCSQPQDGGPTDDGVTCVLECSGPELGGRRHNWFYVSGPNSVPTLDHVRWVILSPRSTPRAPWRAFFLAVADSLSIAMNRAVWAGRDSAEAAWNGTGYTAVMRLHGTSARVDSLELECVSERLAQGGARGHASRGNALHQR